MTPLYDQLSPTARDLIGRIAFTTIITVLFFEMLRWLLGE